VAPRRADDLDEPAHFGRHLAALRTRPTRTPPQPRLADRTPGEIDAAHARVRRERHEGRPELVHVALAQAVLLLREDDDAAAFGSLVRQRRELHGVGQLLGPDAGEWMECGCLAVAQRDRARLVEEQHVDVAGPPPPRGRTSR
jgi:hypothetical protein